MTAVMGDDGLETNGDTYLPLEPIPWVDLGLDSDSVHINFSTITRFEGVDFDELAKNFWGHSHNESVLLLDPTSPERRKNSLLVILCRLAISHTMISDELSDKLKTAVDIGPEVIMRQADLVSMSGIKLADGKSSIPLINAYHDDNVRQTAFRRVQQKHPYHPVIDTVESLDDWLSSSVLKRINTSPAAMQAALNAQEFFVLGADPYIPAEIGRTAIDLMYQGHRIR